MYVRNLQETTDVRFGDYVGRLQDLMPDHANELSEHERIYHDETECPAEDVDPFEMNDATSYSKALIEKDEEVEEEDDEDEEYLQNLYNFDSNSSKLDNETRELWIKII